MSAGADITCQRGSGDMINLEDAAQNMPADVAGYLTQELGVSRETFDRLMTYDALLLDYTARHNLVSRATIPIRWQRHFLDSAQLMPLVPRDAYSLLDFGSGAGFPGLVLAILAADPAFTARRREPLRIKLVESTGKKAVFLEDTARALGLTHVTVENDRVERLANHPGKVDVITARALAKLDRLLDLSAAFVKPTSVLLFPKGSCASSEVISARKNWTFSLSQYQSLTAKDAQILRITRPVRIIRPAFRDP